MPILMKTEEYLTLVLSARRRALQRSPTSFTYPVSIKRSFTWGAKHKWSSNNHGKNISDKVRKANISKSGLHYPYLERQTFIRRFLPAQGWRSASHWRNSRTVCEKKDDPKHTSSGSQEGTEAEDWYSRWERQQKEKFEAFKKKIDQDPFNALFGKSNKWLGWTAETITSGAAKSEEQANVLKKAEEYLKNDKARNAMKDTSYPMATEGYESWSSQCPSGRAPVNQEAEEKEYDIDPITLRKVPKNTKPAPPLNETVAKDTQKAFDVPVKTFKPVPRTTSVPAKRTSSTQVDDWLGREGFGSSQNAPKPMSPSEYGTSVEPKIQALKIQSSLDRHLEEKSPNAEESDSTPKYESKENKNEDVDLLRASDVRASAGKGGESAKESDLARDARRQALEDRYERQQQWLKEEMKRDEYHAKDVEFLRNKAVDDNPAERSVVSKAIKDINDRYLKELSSISAHTGKPSSPYATPLSEIAKAEKLSSFVNDNTRRIQSKIVPLKTQINLMIAEYDTLRQKWLEETRRLKEKKAKKAQEEAKLLENEIKVQKAAMEAAEVYRGEGDMAPNVHQFASRKVVSLPKATELSATEHGGEGDMSPNVVQFASRDRWYKRKAPHAKCEMEAKMQQLAKDKALIREVRGIYEDTYGVIDTKHLQEQPLGEGDMSPDVVKFASSDRWYKRKAPFNAHGFVLPEQKTDANEAYTMLKEDPSAELLTKDATNTSSSTSIPKAEQQSTTPVQEQPVISTATLNQIADLKAQIDKQALQLHKHRKEIRNLRNNKDIKPDHNKESKPGIVRRMEPVFSGRKNKEKKRTSRRRKTFKHVLLTGFVTAACCYATGVVVELMKVNGL